MNKRIHALCDLAVAAVREYVGLHDEYDGRLQDLSVQGVRAGLARLGGPPLKDPLDDAYVAAHERAMRVEFGELELHRRNPLYHVAGLDLSCYDRDYPLAERALAAHARLVSHVEACARDGDPDASLGAASLGLLLSASEAMEVDLGRLEEQADAERDRLRALLADACQRLAPGRPLDQVVAELAGDHPDADGVLAEAQAVTAEAIDFTRERGLVPDLDGECLVGPAPPSRRWALAMMSWAAPYEADAPSRYYITPPDPSWPKEEQEQWLEVFSRSSLPAITVHEVAPGHFAH